MLHVITGSMRSGKSASLVNYTSFLKDKNYKIFYPASLNKSEGYVVSREGNKKAKAIKIFDINDLYNHIEDLNVVMIDEFQFLCGAKDIDNFMSFLEYCDTKNIDIYLFGLQLDYLSKSFDITERVLPYADSIIMLTAICDYCGEPATRCMRLVNGKIDASPDSETLVMESENIEYKSVCKKCYRKLTGLPAIK